MHKDSCVWAKKNDHVMLWQKARLSSHKERTFQRSKERFLCILVCDMKRGGTGAYGLKEYLVLSSQA